MSRTTLATLALAVCPAIATAQSDTTRRDTTRATQPADTSQRIRAESRGEIDLTSGGVRFTAELPNFGLSSVQAAEVQQALTLAGCDVGIADGVVGPRTQRGIECFRARQNVTATDVESLLTALNVSFARPAPQAPPPEPTPPETPALPPVLRPDTTYRAALRARQDSALKRDSTLRRDSLGRDTTARRDTTIRRDTTARRDPR